MNCENEYQCALCGGVFHKDPNVWSDDDAKREFEKNFGKKAESAGELAIICDPCFKRAKAAFPHLFTSAMN